MKHRLLKGIAALVAIGVPAIAALIAVLWIDHGRQLTLPQMLVRSPSVMKMLQIAGILRLEPRRGLAVAAEYIHRFFDVHLKGVPASLMDASSDYPELQFVQDLRSRTSAPAR